MGASASFFPLIDKIADVLFTAERRRLVKFIDNLCVENREAYREPLDGFHYIGRFFRPDGLKGQLNRKVIHPSLQDKLDTHLADEARVKEDEQMIRQILFKLIDPCVTGQDVRDALPECLRDTLGDYGKHPRSREPAFTIQGNPRALRQYNKILPTIEVYSAARLLY